MATQLESPHVGTASAGLEPQLKQLLARLRRRIRSYVWADGLAILVAVLGIAFWLSLGLDWGFEPPALVRKLILAATLAAAGYVVVEFLLGRLSVPLGDHNMALLLERRFGQFKDSLLTSVELCDRPEHTSDFNAEMLAHTHRDAVSHSAGVQVDQVFDPRPLTRHASLAIGLAGALAILAIAAPSALAIWARRNLLFSDELWPRRTHLAVQGFDAQGHAKVARGADLALNVLAEAGGDRVVPEVVQVRFTTSEGARGRENMSREGGVSKGDSPAQSYVHVFRGVLADTQFYVVGGDDRKGPFSLDVVDSPTISMTLHCEYPEYMHRTSRKMPTTQVVQVPLGTQVTVLAQANKPLVGVQVDDVTDEGAVASRQLDLSESDGGSSSTFELPLEPLTADKTLNFSLRDIDRIRSREAIRLALRVVADEAPQVNVQLKGIGSAITPSAHLPAAGEIVDDYGIYKVWFEFHADDDAPQQRPLSVTADGQEKLAVAEPMEARDLGLQPKQKLHWTVRAADGFSLGGPPNVGSAQRYLLDVVTPEQLRSILEAKELTQRRQFEIIIEEFTATRGVLAGIDPAKAAGGAGEAVESVREAVGSLGLQSAGVQVERVRQNNSRSAEEALRVALAHDDIREELINNRIDNEEWMARLKDHVADPLKQLVAEKFPQLEAEVKQLASRLADPQAAVASQAAALAQTDAILLEMKQILAKMLELETFNELLDILRDIITDQEKVNSDTKQRQRQKALDLSE